MTDAGTTPAWTCWTPASWPTIAILTGGFSEQEHRGAGAVTVFDSIHTLCHHLDEPPPA